jgi:DNA polymerase V
MIGLADCNSFFASCETVFRPDLRGKAVVVLSNNDGIIVALSKEAKALGIRRGDALFKIQQAIERNNVYVFSSNYTLYQDLSERIVAILRGYVNSVEPYSIDESFFRVPDFASKAEAQSFALNLHKRLYRETGMRISIGLARTKTLAKAANQLGKKMGGACVLMAEDERQALQSIEVADVWGIGYRRLDLLARLGVRTAWDYACLSDEFLKRKFAITGLSTALELRGKPAIVSESSNRLSFASGISFSEVKDTREKMDEAVACICGVLSDKLQRSDRIASTFGLLLQTSRFGEDYICSYYEVGFTRQTSYLPNLIRAARLCLDRLFVTGKPYKSARAMAGGLIRTKGREWDLEDVLGLRDRVEAQDRMGSAVSSIQRRYGRKILGPAAAQLGLKIELTSRQYLSPCYTTSWESLPLVH